MSNRSKLIIFSDGACSGNPGPGGWGAIILKPDNQVIELGSGESSTTNNRMEMMAALEALRATEEYDAPVDFYTDSTYLIRGITQWCFGWRQRGWLTAEGQQVSNRDLWEQLLVVTRGRKIQWLYSRGHVGIPGNERCDEIAVAYSKNERVQLYRGSLNSYGVDILRLPEDTKLPEMKSNSGEKKVAHSYLSNISGLVYRHKTWSSCERRVKGQSGAKFKKSTSAADEQEILKSWGLGGASIVDGE